MNTVSKDQSIITQVAAKIAADLTPKSDDVLANIANFIVAFDATTDALLGAHGMTKGSLSPDTATAMVMEAFNATVVEPSVNYSQPPVQITALGTGAVSQVRIKGTQHGPIPQWLQVECAKKGVTEVWDNRDGLAVNAKRPWFKSTTSQDAFWEPKPRR